MSYFLANTKRYNPIREARKFSIVPHKPTQTVLVERESRLGVRKRGELMWF